MSETAPERTPSGGGRVKGAFTNRIGPLPMWVWLAIIAAALIAWRLYSDRKAASTPASTGSSVPSADVPQFVNQTYVTATAPQAPAQPPTASPQPVIDYGFRPVPTTPPKQRLQRTWTAPAGGVSTLAQIAQRLTGRPDPALLTPANKTAQAFIAGPYKKNRNAKVPKGATFTYLEGTVTGATQAA